MKENKTKSAKQKTKAEKEFDKQDEALARVLADYQNLVRRHQEERLAIIKLATKEIVSDLLEPLEHLKTAADQIQDRGLTLVVDRLWRQLTEFGVSEIPVLDQPFDVQIMEVIEKQDCPVCKQKTMQLIQEEREIPHFGKCYLMSMNCIECLYHSSDIEVEKKDNPKKYEFTVEKKQDLNVRVIKSSQATVKIPQLRMSVTPGAGSIGYISNIEGLLNRFKAIIESQRDNSEEPSERKAAKNLLKKLWKVELGEQELKIVIEDPSGNSAIVSDKAEVKKSKK